MKKGVKKNFNLSNRLSYTIIAVLAVLLIGVGVYAYSGTTTTTPNTASTMGHTINEIQPPTDCSLGQALTKAPSGSGWSCSNFASTSSVPTGIRSWSYERISNTGTGTSVLASCSSGKTLIAGGCSTTLSLIQSSPVFGNEKWACAVASNPFALIITAYAICVS